MSSKTYWRDRELEWKKKRLKDEQEYADEIQEVYANMMDSVEKEIESFFTRYANKENITMAEAKKKVSNIDIKAYQRKAKKYVKEKNFSDEANEQMRLYNLAMKVNRLELLKANIGLELVAGHDELKSYTGQKLEGAYLEEIKRNASILGNTVIDNAKMAKTVADSSFKNATFSERIWVNQDQLKNSLSSVLSSALIQGKNPREFIPQIRKKFDVSRCNAERLLRTEIARVQTQAQIESYEANGIDEYEYVACGLKDVCPLCKEMDGKVFKLKDMEIGKNAPPMHPNCVLPDTEIIAPGIEAITKSDYSGDVIKFVTANGRSVTVTPNHIVPTSRGWIRAKNLVKGDKVFCYRGCIENGTVGTPTDNNRTATIKNLFTSIIETQGSTTCCVPAASIDLKGDVIPNSKINIIFVDGKLGDKINTLMSKFISDSFLIGTGETRESVLSRDGSLSKLLIRIGLAFDGFMGRFDKGSVFFRSSATSRDLISLRRASDYDARLFKYSMNNPATDFILIGNSQTTHAGSVISDNGSLINLSLSSVNRNSQSNSIFNENFFNSFSSLMNNSRYLSDTFATLIEIDDIIDIQRCFYSGHVYDVSSLSTLYIANGIVTSNCHCATAPYSDRKEYEKWLDGLANGEHSLRFDEWKERQSNKSKGFLMSKVKSKLTEASSDKRYADLSTEWKNDFNIEIDESVKELNYSSVSRALKSLRNMLNQYPEINKYVNRISTSDNGAMVFRPSENGISLNPKFFKDPDAYSKLIKEQVRKGYWIKGTTIESDMVHEAAHVLEFVLLNRNVNYKNTLQKENAWEECNESGKIVLEAFNNLRAKGIIKGNRLKELLNNISGYASKNNSEALAEAFSDCFINGNNAHEISKEIKRLVDIKLKG